MTESEVEFDHFQRNNADICTDSDDDSKNIATELEDDSASASSLPVVQLASTLSPPWPVADLSKKRQQTPLEKSSKQRKKASLPFFLEGLTHDTVEESICLHTQWPIPNADPTLASACVGFVVS